jgi:hypothetical protein
MESLLSLQSLERIQKSPNEILKEGQVLKMKKGFFSKWEKVQLALSPTEIRIFKGSLRRGRSPQDDDLSELAKAQGRFRSFPLKDMIVKDSPTKMKKQEFVFDIFAANNKRLVIAAPSLAEKKDWMSKISTAVHDGKMKQAEVDKELLRLADHIRSQQAQQRARAIPINLAQAVRNPIEAPNDLISTEERKASLYRTASAFPVSSTRPENPNNKDPPPLPLSPKPTLRARPRPPFPAAAAAAAASSTSTSSSSLEEGGRLPYGMPPPVPPARTAATMIISNPTAERPQGMKGVGLLASRGDQHTQLNRHSVSMRSVRELAQLPPSLPPLPNQSNQPPTAHTPLPRPPPRAMAVPGSPTLRNHAATTTNIMATRLKLSSPEPEAASQIDKSSASSTTSTATCASTTITAGSIVSRPPAPPPRRKNSSARKESPSCCPPIVPPRKGSQPELPTAAVLASGKTSAPGNNGSSASATSGGGGGSASGVPTGGASGSSGALPFSPRIRITPRDDCAPPVFERPHAREAAEDTPLTKRPLKPLPPPPMPLGSSLSSLAGSRVEKASAVQWQPRHMLPAPVPRPGGGEGGSQPEKNPERLPPRPPRPSPRK